MAYKDLLLALASYPEPTPVAAIDQAVGIAGLLGARISAVTFELQIPKPVSFYTDAVLDISGMIRRRSRRASPTHKASSTRSRRRRPVTACSRRTCSSDACRAKLPTSWSSMRAC